jgi:hypothetical protein
LFCGECCCNRGAPSERIAAGNVAEIRGAGLDGALLRRAIDGDDAEFGFEAEHPLPIVEQRPGDVAADIHAVVNGAFQTCESTAIILDAASVVVGGDAVFCDLDGHAGFLSCLADDAFDTLRVKLHSHLSEFGALGRGQILFADDGARVGLDAEVVAFFCGFEPGAVGFGAFVSKVAVG